MGEFNGINLAINHDNFRNKVLLGHILDDALVKWHSPDFRKLIQEEPSVAGFHENAQKH
jgi:hypothetical protein